MEREQWLTERRKGIGGSDAAAVLGLNPYSSPLAVYLDKIGEGEKFEGNERTEWGLKLEKLIVAEYELRTGVPVTHNTEQIISVHPDLPWMCCTLDAVAHDPVRGPGVLQAKNVDRYMQGEWNEQVPEHYLIQLMHEIGVTGYSWGALVVLIGGNEWKRYEFDRDEQLISLIIEKERDFWFGNVVARIPPDPTGASLDVLSMMYPKDNGELVPITNGIGKDIINYIIVKERLKELESQEADLKARIQGVMGEAQKGIYQHDDGSIYAVSWSTVSGRVSLDQRALEAEQPEIYQRYCKAGSSYRRFVVSQKKGKLTAQERAMIGG